MNRRRRDIDDMDDDLLDHREAADRKKRREEALAYAVDRQAKLDAEDAAAHQRATAFVKRANGQAVLDEYRRAGVEPIRVDGDGVPTTSLSMLLWMGWTIEDVSGEKKLVRPPLPTPPKPRPPQECT